MSQFSGRFSRGKALSKRLKVFPEYEASYFQVCAQYCSDPNNCLALLVSFRHLLFYVFHRTKAVTKCVVTSALLFSPKYTLDLRVKSVAIEFILASTLLPSHHRRAYLTVLWCCSHSTFIFIQESELFRLTLLCFLLRGATKKGKLGTGRLHPLHSSNNKHCLVIIVSGYNFATAAVLCSASTTHEDQTTWPRLLYFAEKYSNFFTSGVLPVDIVATKRIASIRGAWTANVKS